MLGTLNQVISRIGRLTESIDPLDRLRRPEIAPATGVVESWSRYDLVLTVIPAAFVFALLADAVLSLSPRTSMVAASIFAALVLVDALFVNPPRDSI